MEKWVGKVAVITGASAGIGAALVQALAQRGVIVVALARRADKLKEVVAASNGKVYPRVCDLGKEEDIVAAFAWVEKTLGGVDILINNAGQLNPSLLTAGKTSDWRGVLETNVLALSISTREAVQSMRKRGDNGHIIHINSIVGRFVTQMAMMGMYAASKYAVSSLTESLRLELRNLGSNIKITSLSPGCTDTEMLRSFNTDRQADAGPVVAALHVDDISDAVVYVLSTRPIVQVHELTIQPIGQDYTG